MEPNKSLALTWAVLSNRRSNVKNVRGVGVRGKSSKHPEPIRKPSGRAHHAACIVENRFLLVHGGNNGLRPISCCWALDLATSIWTEVSTDGHSMGEAKCVADTLRMPSARYGHSLSYLPDHKIVLLLGGLDACKKSVPGSDIVRLVVMMVQYMYDRLFVVACVVLHWP
jgi:hypothetical protein